ncbi:oxygenase MpaB family protein [Ketobacter alkanivorans]|uniref:ER-bound oxygenase mpaB/mpaB'/Rubber oxygenase catalytic domain-containing protein n=1 Tax=Ketobacter alkanivorans TaxID=1917421 RepID=A0A2K9LPL9_9GAMM|nr:oxygenase MpaB family protein [Ketobacter alkanivorans]AUM13415.1 hypothetical protein Kalk_13725 [Ketobacter alkanivorans]MCP5019902.1 DUF2236 domain-containing protein [Ketobacter sp.]
MNSAAKKQVEDPKPSHQPIQTQWAPQSGKEIDAAIPGCIDSVGLLSGVANTIMQLAYPGVGHGVMESRVESGSILHHPIKRARTTLTYLAVAMQGTTEEKLAYRRAINVAHAQVTSTEASPIKYRALDPELQLWVAACLFWGHVDVYEKLRGPMSQADLERFYEYAKPLGTTLQVRPDMWPKDINAFWVYWNENLDRMEMPEDVRDWLLQLVDLSFAGPAVSIPFGRFAKLMTAGFLHPRIRTQMGLKWGDKEQRNFNRIIKLLGAVNNRMPRQLRQLPSSALLWDFRRRLKNGLPLN